MLASCGRAVAWARVEVLGKDGAPLAPGEIRTGARVRARFTEASAKTARFCVDPRPLMPIIPDGGDNDTRQLAGGYGLGSASAGSDISSSARHMSVMSTMPTRSGPPMTGRCRKRPLVMTLAASRMLVAVLTTVGRAVIS